MNNSVCGASQEASQVVHEEALDTGRASCSTQRATQQGLDRAIEGLDHARTRTTNDLHHLTQDAESLAHWGMEAAREGSHQLRDKSVHAKDATTQYIRHAPFKSMLMAAAAGAALMGLAALLNRRNAPHH